MLATPRLIPNIQRAPATSTQDADLLTVSDDAGISIRLAGQSVEVEFELSAERLNRMGWFRVTAVRDGEGSPGFPGSSPGGGGVVP